jgi:hypothetical protein
MCISTKEIRKRGEGEKREDIEKREDGEGGGSTSNIPNCQLQQHLLL